MNNTEIHHKLAYAELRNFLSISLDKINDKLNADLVMTAYSELEKYSVIDRELIRNKTELTHLQERKKILEEWKAVEQIIAMQNWHEFDVSDYTLRDSSTHSWLSFIGTSEEYNALLSTIKKKK